MSQHTSPNLDLLEVRIQDLWPMPHSPLLTITPNLSEKDPQLETTFVQYLFLDFGY